MSNSAIKTTTEVGAKEYKNPLLEHQIDFLFTLSDETRNNFFSDDHITSETRAQIWSDQAELGEQLVNQYSWATPDSRTIKIIKYYSSKCSGIVEIGCGSNAYWANIMKDNDIDVLAFDAELKHGGKISSDNDVNDVMDNNFGNQSFENNSNSKKRKHDDMKNIINNDNEHENTGNEDVTISKAFDNGLVINKGGPDILSSLCKYKDIDNRVLFLCYPDEDVYIEDENGQSQNNTEDDEEEYRQDIDVLSSSPSSMGSACLDHFQGDTIIHVGELYGDTLSIDHAPWGRSSGAEFQQRLFSEYHCILKAKLSNWLHVRDTISVWKRTRRCTIVFQGNGDENDDEESDYKHIPKDELIQTDMAAPCAEHLL